MTRWTEDQARAMGIPDGLKSGQCVTRAQRRIARGSPDLAETDVQGMLAKVPQDKRRKPRLPNKTETRFRDDFLSRDGAWRDMGVWGKVGYGLAGNRDQCAGQVLFDRFEFAPIALNYGAEIDPAWYRADWVLWRSMEVPHRELCFISLPMIYIEVKGGHIYPAARERFQAAAGRHPWATFMMWQQRSRRAPWECLHASGPMAGVFV